MNFQNHFLIFRNKINAKFSALETKSVFKNFLDRFQNSFCLSKKWILFLRCFKRILCIGFKTFTAKIILNNIEKLLFWYFYYEKFYISMLVYFLIFVAYLMYVCIHTSAKIKFCEITAARIQSNRFGHKWNSE